MSQLSHELEIEKPVLEALKDHYHSVPDELLCRMRRVLIENSRLRKFIVSLVDTLRE